MSGEQGSNNNNSTSEGRERARGGGSSSSSTCTYLNDALTVFVVGASGDLARKKTYPSLYELYRHGYLDADQTTICGYARSDRTDKQLRDDIRPYLEKKTTGTNSEDDGDAIEKFLNLCIYRRGNYDSPDDVGKAFDELEKMEEEHVSNIRKKNQQDGGRSCGGCEGGPKVCRLYYFAIPPTVFVPIGRSLKEAVVSKSDGGKIRWHHLIVEKPFGHDLESFEKLNGDMGDLFDEKCIYRIDHYLGKEMVQNLVVLRFGNATWEPLWNRNYVKSVIITFKEDFGTKGRGGYFDSFGIIRDVIQNHLMQVMSLVAMEPPVAVTDGGGGDSSAAHVRNEKVKVLNCIEPVRLEDCVLGQYMAAPDGSEPSYTGDPTVPDDSVTPTFASVVLWINNPRWEGVPFVLKAGKALNERKAEIRVQFKQAPAARAMFAGQEIPENELVMRLQPDEAVYMKTNVKSPGLRTKPVTSELDLTYRRRYDDAVMFDAYTRLILEVLRGRQATFVRDDELEASWKIFTPLLHRIERDKIKPIQYEYGSRGPAESDDLIERVGYSYHGGSYQWNR